MYVLIRIDKMFLFVVGLIALSSFRLTQGQDADPVKVTVYYESLCPDSIRFFTKQLEPTYNELHDIMEVETYAYGKATDVPRETNDGYTFTCQHGPDECYGNKVLGCGQQYITDHDTYLNFTFCIMGADYPPSSGSECASTVGVTYDAIETCANSTEGEIVLHNVGLIEAQLDPPLTYVPWILINDVYSDENLHDAQRDLKGLVCATYEGTPPPECST